MPVIGNIIPRVITSGVFANGTTNPASGWSWSYVGNVPAGNLGSNTNSPVPGNNQTYFYTALGRYGYDTGLQTIMISPVGGRTEIDPLNASGITTITFSWTNNNAGGTGATLFYLELAGVILANSSALTGTFVLTLDASQSNWILTNGNSLKYRLYSTINGNPANMSASVVSSGSGFQFANVR